MPSGVLPSLFDILAWSWRMAGDHCVCSENLFKSSTAPLPGRPWEDVTWRDAPKIQTKAAFLCELNERLVRTQPPKTKINRNVLTAYTMQRILYDVMHMISRPFLNNKSFCHPVQWNNKKTAQTKQQSLSKYSCTCILFVVHSGLW